MSDDDLTPDDIADLLPLEVKAALADESDFIATRVRSAQGTWDKKVAVGLSYLPWVGDIFEENTINTAAATSDVNREARLGMVIAKIEQTLGAKLGQFTVDGIRELIYNLYNTDINLDDL
jgi:hypothetical protein